MRKLLLAGVALATTLGLAPAQAATIIGAVSATATSETSSTYGIQNAINQSGLSAGYTSGVTDFDAYIASGPTHSLSATTEWFGAFGTLADTLIFNLGSVFDIGRIALWNEESSGFGKGVVSTSTDGITYTLLTTLFPIDNPYADYKAEVFSFAEVAAQYFKIEVSECPQPIVGSYQSCAMGEIAFSTDDGIAPVPVPAAAPLFVTALGLLGIGGARRRRNRRS